MTLGIQILLNSEFAVHSKSENDLSLVDRFNFGEVNIIASVGMLERGVDFLNVDYLIIVQSSGSQVSQLQKTGRSYLSLAPKIIVIYYPNTQDEKYVQEFLKQFKPEWIIHKTL